MKNYFQTWELVPWKVWLMLGENARNLMCPWLVQDMNKLRHWAKVPFTCNTRGPGGRDASGLRLPNQKYYSEGSQHSGNHGYRDNHVTAMDIVSELDVKVLHKEILMNPDKYPNIKFIEVDIAWLHADSRTTKQVDCQVWSPNRGWLTREAYLTEIA